MSDKERLQLNLRLDGHRELYEAVKAEAAKQNTSVNSFVINALQTAVGWQQEQPHQQVSLSLEVILEAVENRLDEILDKKLEQRLGELIA
ncbi:toxin-antitoxin system HicB family antitoxin [Anabaena azotica]|uniref:Toxin-antitoxin system HicB family antitoxin n=1 Tax=Anabaena azotica FACHB-119 TaxID=947527 RepID=A0ABR8DEQ0_9NOST|nr:toxin-antitoxin system HicB family antitoxin [Anabaena azotica]MBD2504591.1 toxin-antitoxin system HicB family antitoxin [Anabaena azotica FACHB-119]